MGQSHFGPYAGFLLNVDLMVTELFEGSIYGVLHNIIRNESLSMNYLDSINLIDIN